jgi:hypothetical protein
MTVVALVILVAGLAAGVVSMVGGIDARERGGLRVRYVNLPTFAAAATVFGIVAYPLARYTTLGRVAIVIIAVAAAAGAASAMVGVIAGWAVPSAAKEVKDPRFERQGEFARITRAIGERDGGEIEYVAGGTPQRVRARSLDGTPIELGAEVVIERIEDGVAYVERWTKIARQLELPA